MEFKVETADVTTHITVKMEDGPVWEYEPLDRMIRLVAVELTYTLDADGAWDTQSRHDIVLSGTDLEGEGWYSTYLPGSVFSGMDRQVPWLYEMIETLMPSGDVDLSATFKHWGPA